MYPEALRALFLSYLSVSNNHTVDKMQTFYADPIYINDIPRSPASGDRRICSFMGWVSRLAVGREAHHHRGRVHCCAIQPDGHPNGQLYGDRSDGPTGLFFRVSLYHMVNGKFTEIWDLNDRDQAIAQVLVEKREVVH